MQQLALVWHEHEQSGICEFVRAEDGVISALIWCHFVEPRFNTYFQMWVITSQFFDKSTILQGRKRGERFLKTQ